MIVQDWPEGVQRQLDELAEEEEIAARREAHRRAQARRFYWEYAAIAALVLAAFLNAAWQLGWLS